MYQYQIMQKIANNVFVVSFEYVYVAIKEYSKDKYLMKLTNILTCSSCKANDISFKFSLHLQRCSNFVFVLLFCSALLFSNLSICFVFFPSFCFLLEMGSSKLNSIELY